MTIQKTKQDVYEIFVQNSYYGTIKVNHSTKMLEVIKRVKRLFPKLENKEPFVDYKIKFINTIVPVYNCLVQNDD